MKSGEKNMKKQEILDKISKFIDEHNEHLDNIIINVRINKKEEAHSLFLDEVLND